MLDEHIRGYISADAQRFLDELKERIAIPASARCPGLRARLMCAGPPVADRASGRIGLRTTLIETSGHPLVNMAE
ncbi:MAG: hypothetical protein IPO81_18645 [Kouleothrix sp.]|nr:hypothetical protein [Kouleothrix sp.]